VAKKKSKQKQKRKVRVALRKNRKKRTRNRSLTQQARTDPERLEDALSQERVTGKGDVNRYRTVIGEDDGAGGVQIDVDESACVAGRVLSAVGQTCRVQAADGRLVECTVRRLVRSIDRDQRNAVVTGDRVRPLDDDSGVIERVEPRTGVVSRRSRGREHLFVANIELLLIVMSADDPKPALIDRFLVSAEQGGVAAAVCLNKIDLVDPVRIVSLAGLYSRLGYDVVLTSATTADGLGRLKTLLAGRETVLAGQSGVGKSSLLNAIDPGLKLRTGSLSESSGKGRHVTRRTRLLELSFGGWVVDTPGIRQLGLWDVIPDEVEVFFIEFRPFVALCHFPDCSHTHEGNCAVKQAVEDGLVHSSRYASYLRIHAGDELA